MGKEEASAERGESWNRVERRRNRPIERWIATDLASHHDFSNSARERIKERRYPRESKRQSDANNKSHEGH